MSTPTLLSSSASHSTSKTSSSTKGPFKTPTSILQDRITELREEQQSWFCTASGWKLKEEKIKVIQKIKENHKSNEGVFDNTAISSDEDLLKSGISKEEIKTLKKRFTLKYFGASRSSNMLEEFYASSKTAYNNELNQEKQKSADRELSDSKHFFRSQYNDSNLSLSYLSSNPFDEQNAFNGSELDTRKIIQNSTNPRINLDLNITQSELIGIINRYLKEDYIQLSDAEKIEKFKNPAYHKDPFFLFPQKSYNINKYIKAFAQVGGDLNITRNQICEKLKEIGMDNHPYVTGKKVYPYILEVENCYSYTPLIRACSICDKASVEALLKYGVDVNAIFKDIDGTETTALECALYSSRRYHSKNNNIEIMAMLVKAGAAAVKDWLIPIVTLGNIEIVDLFLQSYSDDTNLDTRSSKDWHIPPEYDDSPINKYYKLAHLSDKGDIPLHWALRLCRSDIVMLMINKGATFNELNINFRTFEERDKIIEAYRQHINQHFPNAEDRNKVIKLLKRKSLFYSL